MNERQLDRVFHALSHQTRRALLAQLSDGSQRVTDLATPFDMSLNAVSKHLKVLEGAKLIRREIDGRVHHCSFEGGSLRGADQWLDYYRHFWESKLDALEKFAAEDDDDHDDGAGT
jgi:DNA-binding transcriptional ArsR family regulator